MQKSWKVSSLFIFAALLAGVMVISSSETAEARPKYRLNFQKSYEKVAANNKITCFVCHGKTDGKMDKEKRNNYAQALEKAIGKKNETNDDAIKAALTKIEDEDSEEDGKTFGDLLHAGQLPAEIDE